MAFIGPADVTVTLNPEDIDRSPDGRIGMRTFPTVAFGNGVLHYSALGIHMPAIGKFGFHFAIKRAYIEQPGNGYIYSFDRANHKLRIFLGAAIGAITVDAITAGTPAGSLANLAAGAFTGDAKTPTGNLSNLAAGAFTGDSKTPTGNLANLAAGAFTGDAATPTGNLSNLTASPHSHGLVLSTANAILDAVGINGTQLVSAANGATIPGGDAANGGIANTTPANGAGVFTGDAKTPTGNVANGTGVFTGDAVTPTGNVANGTGKFTGDASTPTGNVANGTGGFVGDALATHTHGLTGAGGTAEAALAEMDSGVAPAATTLYMEMVGR